MNSIKNEVQFSKNSLTLENVELSKGYKKLFSNFNLKFKYGKIYFVVGSNGIGKTTLLKCICGLTIPDSGDIFWNNIPIKSNLKDFANVIQDLVVQPLVIYPDSKSMKKTLMISPNKLYNFLKWQKKN